MTREEAIRRYLTPLTDEEARDLLLLTEREVREALRGDLKPRWAPILKYGRYVGRSA